MSHAKKWEVVIGLETHAQLKTKSKIFSGSSVAFGAAPNAQASAVDIALPGILPVLNRQAVACAIKFGLAVGATIAPRSVFARKNYFYPDLPKGYQISQFETPVVSGGSLTVSVGAGDTALQKKIHLTRAHLEEDAGKSLHEDFHGKTGIDLNRAGTPLLEIVTEPEMRSSAEAVAYAKALHALVQWIGICDGNMQEGSFRCDANVSVRPVGQAKLGTRREIKNLNSFRFMQQAIDYEVSWQINENEEGREISQATVLFDPTSGETRAMRSKEDAHDYRYFPDPDLLPLDISPAWITEISAAMPELPQAMQSRFVAEYGLSVYDAAALTSSREIANYFVDTLSHPITGPAKLCANWIMGEVAARLNKEGLTFDSCPVPTNRFAELMKLVADGHVNNSGAKEVLAHMWLAGGQNALLSSPAGKLALTESGSPSVIVRQLGLQQISDIDEIEALVDKVLVANPKSVEEFRAGKEKAFNALVGQAMKATKGKANPQQVTELLRRKLSA